MSEFQRENRYLVLKRKDLEKLPRRITDPLNFWLEENARHLPNRQYVVIESDWPEYEVAFKLIEARVTGKPSEIDELRAALAKAEQENDAMRSRIDALRKPNPIGKITVKYGDCCHFFSETARVGDLLYTAAGAARSIPQGVRRKLLDELGAEWEGADGNEWDDAVVTMVENYFAAPLIWPTEEEVIEIANEAHRAMPDDADDQEELLEVYRGIKGLFSNKNGGAS